MLWTPRHGKDQEYKFFGLIPDTNVHLDNKSLGASFMLYFSARLVVFQVCTSTPDWVCSNARDILEASNGFGKT